MISRRPIALLLSLVLAVALGAGLAACGEDEPSVDELLAQTFGEDKDVKSGRLDMRLRLDLQGVQGLQGPVTIRLGGPFASTGEKSLPRFDFGLALNAGGQSFNAGAVSTGDQGFLRFQGQAYRVPDQLFQQFKQGYAQSAQRSGQDGEGNVSFKALGVDPRRWLQNARLAGEEEVGGAETWHIAAGLDVPTFLQDLNTILQRADQLGVAQGRQVRQLSEADRRRIAEAIKAAKIDIYTGKDDTVLRRLGLDLRFDVPQAQQAQANGLQGGTVAFTVSVADLNEDVDVNAPENARPLEQLLGQFGGQVPGLGGGQSGTGQSGGGRSGGQSGATAEPAPPAGASQEYLECAQRAGGDVAKLQECADLLN